MRLLFLCLWLAACSQGPESDWTPVARPAETPATDRLLAADNAPPPAPCLRNLTQDPVRFELESARGTRHYMLHGGEALRIVETGAGLVRFASVGSDDPGSASVRSRYYLLDFFPEPGIRCAYLFRLDSQGRLDLYRRGPPP